MATNSATYIKSSSIRIPSNMGQMSNHQYDVIKRKRKLISLLEIARSANVRLIDLFPLTLLSLIATTGSIVANVVTCWFRDRRHWRRVGCIWQRRSRMIRR